MTELQKWEKAKRLPGVKEGVGVKGKRVWLQKDNRKDPCGERKCSVSLPMSIFWLCYSTIVLQDTMHKGYTKSLSVLFLLTAYESTRTSN